MQFDAVELLQLLQTHDITAMYMFSHDKEVIRSSSMPSNCYQLMTSLQYTCLVSHINDIPYRALISRDSYFANFAIAASIHEIMIRE